MLNSRNNSENFILFFDNGEGEFYSWNKYLKSVRIS